MPSASVFIFLTVSIYREGFDHAKCFFMNGTAMWYGPDLTCLPIGTNTGLPFLVGDYRASFSRSRQQGFLFQKKTAGLAFIVVDCWASFSIGELAGLPFLEVDCRACFYSGGLQGFLFYRRTRRASFSLWELAWLPLQWRLQDFLSSGGLQGFLFKRETSRTSFLVGDCIASFSIGELAGFSFLQGTSRASFSSGGLLGFHFFWGTNTENSN